MDRAIRARVLVSEAQALGLDVEDLVAAAAGAPRAAGPAVPTVSEYIAKVTPTFTKGTLRTYRTYWRLAEAHVGDKRIDAVTVDGHGSPQVSQRSARSAQNTALWGTSVVLHL